MSLDRAYDIGAKLPTSSNSRPGVKTRDIDSGVSKFLRRNPPCDIYVLFVRIDKEIEEK